MDTIQESFLAPFRDGQSGHAGPWPRFEPCGGREEAQGDVDSPEDTVCSVALVSSQFWACFLTLMGDPGTPGRARNYAERVDLRTPDMGGHGEGQEMWPRAARSPPLTYGGRGALDLAMEWAACGLLRFLAQRHYGKLRTCLRRWWCFPFATAGSSACPWETGHVLGYQALSPRNESRGSPEGLTGVRGAAAPSAWPDDSLAGSNEKPVK